VSEAAKPELDAPTLELDHARFRGADSPSIELTLRSHSRRVGLIGDWGLLFRALSGEASVASGAARIFGFELRAALAENALGVARCDPELPQSFSVREYLEHAARLSHGSRARAQSDARRTLADFGLAELNQKKLGELRSYQRRALGIALAAVTSPAVLCLESPLRDLDAASADYVARLCLHASERSRVILSCATPTTPSPERALLDQCQELFAIAQGTLLAHGAPEALFSATSRYLVTLSGTRYEEFAHTLGETGCELTQQPSPAVLNAFVSRDAQLTRYMLELPTAGSTDLVLDAALHSGMIVLELEPIWNYFHAAANRQRVDTSHQAAGLAKP
jgi:ABC-type multidrug transport system ATPase subunit